MVQNNSTEPPQPGWNMTQKSHVLPRGGPLSDFHCTHVHSVRLFEASDTDLCGTKNIDANYLKFEVKGCL